MKRTAPALLTVVLLVGMLVSAGVLTALAARADRIDAPKIALDPILSPHQFRLLFQGMGPALADVYWIRAISTAGAALESPGGTVRLYQLLERVVAIDPQFEPAYQYGALLLSVRGDRPDLGDKLLHAAEQRFPDNWEYPFYLGFNRFYYAADFLAAADYFERAATLPGAPDYFAALAPRFRDQQHNQATARDLLRRLIRISDDPVIKQRLERRMAELQVPS